MNHILCHLTLDKQEFVCHIDPANPCYSVFPGCDIVLNHSIENGVTRILITVKNETDHDIILSTIMIGGTAGGNILHYFSSSWGAEFTPHIMAVDAPHSFSSSSGRSCFQNIPFAAVENTVGAVTFTLSYSGCWDCEIIPTGNGCEVTMGIGGFFTTIKKGDDFTSPAVYIAAACDIETATLKMRRYFRANLSPIDEIKDLPVAINSWWTYQDLLIDENVFQANNVIASKLGATHCVLDAGWFGEESTDKETDWFLKRGDWDNVNTVRFPSGMKILCDKANGVGIKPGIWCEIEAVGKNAKLLCTHPQLVATKNGESLGYICFGSEETRSFAMDVMDKLIGEYGATWIKLDFNLDPAPGCDVTSHGHGKGDGLHSHYQGYYKFLDDVRAKYPGVILENCASGGQRMDIGMLTHTHVTFLSDPDLTDFHLQCFWGALSYLHQSVCYHFSWSELILCTHNNGILNPLREDLPLHEFDYMIRSVLMGVPGFCYDLPNMPEWCKERLAHHISLYKEISHRFIKNGDAYRLTKQPLKDGGERFPAFQFNSQDGDTIVFAFRLVGGKHENTVKLYEITGAIYSVHFVDACKTIIMTGTQLRDIGLTFENLPENASEIVRITPIAAV